MNSIATTLRALRAETGLTLQEFAAQCGLSHSTVLRYEKGEVSPTVDALEKIAEGTGKPLLISFGPPIPEAPNEIVFRNGSTMKLAGTPQTEFQGDTQTLINVA